MKKQVYDEFQRVRKQKCNEWHDMRDEWKRNRSRSTRYESKYEAKKHSATLVAATDREVIMKEFEEMYGSEPKGRRQKFKNWWRNWLSDYNHRQIPHITVMVDKAPFDFKVIVRSCNSCSRPHCIKC